MTDTTLNRFVSSGNESARASYTPSVPTPASGPAAGYVWAVTDTHQVYGSDGTTAFRAGSGVSGVTVTSSTTILIGSGSFFHVSGTTTIADIDFTPDHAGRDAILCFDGILTLTHNATSLILPTGANITTAAGDCCMVVSEDGSNNVRVAWYQRKDGSALVGSGSSGALILITETVTSGSAAHVTFSSIATTYRDLIVVIRGRGDTGASIVNVSLQFNGDTGANYHSTIGVFNASIASSAGSQSQTSITRILDLPAASATANYAATCEIIIGDYRGTTFFKSCVGYAGLSLGTGATSTLTEAGNGIWLSTAAINAVKVFLSAGNFVDGSVVSLYGRM